MSAHNGNITSSNQALKRKTRLWSPNDRLFYHTRWKEKAIGKVQWVDLIHINRIHT